MSTSTHKRRQKSYGVEMLCGQRLREALPSPASFFEYSVRTTQHPGRVDVGNDRRKARFDSLAVGKHCVADGCLHIVFYES